MAESTIPQPDPDEKLVKIFDTEQENEAIVVKGLLESAGIESDLKSIAAVQETFPGVGGNAPAGARRRRSRSGKNYRRLPQLATPRRRDRNQCLSAGAVSSWLLAT